MRISARRTVIRLSIVHRRIAAMEPAGASYQEPSIIRSRPTPEQEAFRAWDLGGSMSLGLWLAKYKERMTGRRNFTVEEYGRWVRTVKSME